jgi:hypothetical protein
MVGNQARAISASPPPHPRRFIFRSSGASTVLAASHRSALLRPVCSVAQLWPWLAGRLDTAMHAPGTLPTCNAALLWPAAQARIASRLDGAAPAASHSSGRAWPAASRAHQPPDIARASHLAWRLCGGDAPFVLSRATRNELFPGRAMPHSCWASSLAPRQTSDTRSSGPPPRIGRMRQQCPVLPLERSSGPACSALHVAPLRPAASISQVLQQCCPVCSLA